MMASNRIAAGTGIKGIDSNQLTGPRGIFVDVNLDLYVTDCNNNRIQLFQSGERTGITVAGSESPKPTITLFRPTGVILDAEKYLFIVEMNNHRIVGSGLNGFRCLVGCNGAGSQSNQLTFPYGFSFDHSGNMFVTDTSNDRIQKFKYLKRYCRTPVNIQLKYSSKLTDDSPTYYRDCQVPQCHYETSQIHVTTTGLYVLWSESNINVYGYIYQNDFDPLKPSENLLLSHDSPKESSCVIGDQCNFHIKGIGLTLDDILRNELQPNKVLNNQSFSIKLSAALTIIIFVAGLINSILSFITFQHKDSQQVGCGMYLLTSSITSLLTISMFIIKFWFVVLTHINVSASLSVLRGGCVSIESILKLFLYLDGWLNACVAVERVVLVFKGVNFDKKKSKSIARRTILILPFCILGTLIHELAFRRLFVYETTPETTDTNVAMVNNKTQCFTCNQDKITYLCEGCLKNFCLMDLTKHRQILNEELHHIINDYDQFKQIFNEQKPNSDDLSLINQINQWEINSIKKIQLKARDCREIVIKSSQTFLNDIEKKFNDLNEQIKQIHIENEFNEINLNHFRNQLKKMTLEINNPPKTSIQQDSQPFINDISIISTKEPKFNKWKQNSISVAGGAGFGQKLYQLKYPYGIFIDEYKNIFIADYNSHRIVEWKYNSKEGQIIAGENNKGNAMNKLNHPPDVIVNQQNHSIIIADQGNRRVIQWWNQNQQILINNIDCFGLAMDKHRFLYISDYKKNEVRRWKVGEYNNDGIVMAGGYGQGNKLNQLNYPGCIFVDEEQSVYVSDQNNDRVMKWGKDAKEGRLVAGGNGKGGNLNQLSYPRGVIVDDLGQIYVVDMWNHRVIRWCEGKEEGEIVVGGNEKGCMANQLNNPFGLSFDNEGNLHVVDCGNARIQKFEIIL
ncbi:unnamed protein product [Adineta steineri]|nr:unnamed protein product [Adineta steineri]